MTIYYTDPDKNTVELFYDTAFTEEQLVAFYGGDEVEIPRPVPFDPAQALKELKDGRSVAELTAWAPAT